MVEKIFFQASMPRAGSELLQTIMNSRPDVYASVTDPSLEYLFGARANYSTTPEVQAQDSELMKKAFLAFCNGGLTAYANSLVTDEKYVVLKSRGWSKYRGFLESFYDEPKIICCVRNLKSIVASYEKMFRANAHFHSPINSDSQGRGGTIFKRMVEWLDAKQTIGMATERLYGCIEQGYDNKILYVKYEDLCLNPTNEMVRIYNYLGIPFFEHDFDNLKQTVIEDSSVYGMGEGLHYVRPKLEMQQDNSDEILGKDNIAWLFENFNWYYRKFGYKK